MELLELISFWHWVALGIVLVIMDVAFGANFILLWSGLAAFAVGIILWFVPSLAWQWQFILFGVGVMLSLVVWRKYIKSMPSTSDAPHLNRRAQQYVGREFKLESPIEQGRGWVHVDDSRWRVEGEDLPAGTRVRVIEATGVVLRVEKV